MNALRPLTMITFALLAPGGCCYFRDTCGADDDTGVWSQRQVPPVQVWLDNRAAEWAGTGYRIPTAVSVTPLFRYMVNGSADLGSARDVTIEIFQRGEGAPSETHAYVVTACGGVKAHRALRDKRTHRLGAPNEGLCYADGQGQPVDQMTLRSNASYLMKLVVSADRAETLQVEFHTR